MNITKEVMKRLKKESKTEREKETNREKEESPKISDDLLKLRLIFGALAIWGFNIWCIIKFAL